MLWTIGIALGIAVLNLGLNYNSLVKLENTVEVAWSQIEVQLKRRHNLIPNLVKTTKEYMDYEQQVLTEVAEARSKAVKARNVAQQAEAESELNQSLDKLIGVIEDYPELKANQSFLDLQEELVSTENRIAFGRQSYNDAVLYFNNKVEMFPSNIIASFFDFKTKDYFEVEHERERELPEIDIKKGGI